MKTSTKVTLAARTFVALFVALLGGGCGRRERPAEDTGSDASDEGLAESATARGTAQEGYYFHSIALADRRIARGASCIVRPKSLLSTVRVELCRSYSCPSPSTVPDGLRTGLKSGSRSVRVFIAKLPGCGRTTPAYNSREGL